MAERIWMGTSDSNYNGNWSTTGCWSVDGITRGASVPTAADVVYFYDYGSTYTVTISSSVLCYSMFNYGWSGVTFTGSGNLSIWGNEIYVDAGNSTWNVTGGVFFKSTTVQTWVAFTAPIPSAVYFQGSAGVIMSGTMSLSGTSNSIFHSLGLVDLNSFSINCPIWNSNYTTSRSIDFKLFSRIYLSQAGSGATVLSLGTATNFNAVYDPDWDGTYGGFSSVTNVARTFSVGAPTGTNNPPNLEITDGAAVPTIASGSHFTRLDLSGTTGTGSLGTTTINCKSIMFGSNPATGVTLNMVNGNNISYYGIGDFNDPTYEKTIANLNITLPVTVGAATAQFTGSTLTVTGTTTINSGTLRMPYGCTIYTGTFSSSNSSIRGLSGEGYNNIYLTNTGSGTTLINMATATNFTFTEPGYYDPLSFVVANLSSAKTFTVGTSGAPVNNIGPRILVQGGNALPTFTSGSYIGEIIAMDGINSAWSINVLNTVWGVYYVNPLGTKSITTVNTFATDNTYPGCYLAIGGNIGTVNINNSPSYSVGTVIDGNSPVITVINHNNGRLEVRNGNTTTAQYNVPYSATAERMLYLETYNMVLTGAANSTPLNAPRPGNFMFIAGGTGEETIVSTTNVVKNFNWANTSYTNNEAMAQGGYTHPNLQLSGNIAPVIATNSCFKRLDLSGMNVAVSVGGGTGVINAARINLSPVGTNAFIARIGGSVPNYEWSGEIGGGIVSKFEITNYIGAALISNVTATETAPISGEILLQGFTLNTSTFTSTTANSRGISGPGVVNNVSNWTASGGTWSGIFNTYTINMIGSTFNGGNGNYGILNKANTGTLTVTGSNYFRNLSATTLPATFVFPAGSTQTFDEFTLTGTASNLITIQSSVSGSQVNFSKAGGFATPSYISIKDTNATGLAEWHAFNGTITDAGNNTGWYFIRPSRVNGQFLVFFEGIS